MEKQEDISLYPDQEMEKAPEKNDQSTKVCTANNLLTFFGHFIDWICVASGRWCHHNNTHSPSTNDVRTKRNILATFESKFKPERIISPK